MSDDAAETVNPETNDVVLPMPEKAPAAKPLLSLDFDLSPAWAKGASTTQKYQSHSGKGDHTQSRDRKSGGDRRGPPRPGGVRPGGAPRVSGGGGTRPDVGRRDMPGRDDRFRGGQSFQRREPLPLEVRFVPSQRAIGQLAKQIRATHKAYPLMQVAAYLMGNSANYMVRLQVRREVEHFVLHQCRICKTIGLLEQAMIGHLMTHHLAEIVDVKEEEGEAFTGEFACVTQCGLSGVLLGPPNHHSFAEKLREVHATRFSNMGIEDYRGRVKTIHDKALVEQWKEESRKRRTYSVKTGDTVTELKTWTDVELYVTRTKREALIETTRRALVPAPVAQQIEDQDLTGTLESAYRRELQFPLHMSLALRSSLRHMGFTLFRLDRERVYVASVEPIPMDVTHAVPLVQKMVAYLNQQPRTKRETVLAELQVSAPAEQGELVTTLAWLIERGHIIELSDTALMLPSDAGFANGEPERSEQEEEPVAEAMEAVDAGPANEPLVTTDPAAVVPLGEGTVVPVAEGPAGE
jgi:hypothetical protein